MRKEILEMMRNAGCTEEDISKAFSNLDNATDEQILESIKTNEPLVSILEKANKG